MSAMKPGAVWLLVKAPPKPQPTICRCMSSTMIADNSLMSKHSRNVTNINSPGFVRRDDPVYINLPVDSRKPPAAIDASGKTYKPSCALFMY